MKNRRNYYRILHVQPDAPAEVIRTSYRTMMHRLKMHPDLGGDHWNAAVINEAFEVLSDPEKRAAYDKTLKGPRNPRRRDEATPTPKTETQKPKAPAKADRNKTSHNCSFCAARYEARVANSPDAVCSRCQSPLFQVSRHEGLTATRRAMERLPRRMQVTGEVAGRTGVQFEMTTEDISLQGLRATTSYELSRGQRLKIKCPFGTAVGVVTHVVAFSGAPGQWHAGVQFLTLQVTENRGAFLSVEG